MPKSDQPRKSSEHQQKQLVTHPSEILELLDPGGEPCQFEPIARDLARAGLHVHPLRPGDKRPLLKGYQRLASTDPDTLAQWAEDYPNANAGIVTGPESGVIALDCDLRHGAAATLDWLKRQHGELPLTWTALTPNGWHFYFRHPGGQVRGYNRLGSGVELKGDGANLVGPGSRHATGLQYRWGPYQSPDDIPLASPPGWLLELLKRKDKWKVPGKAHSEVSQVNILGPLGLGEGVEIPGGVRGSLTGADILSFFSQEYVIQKILGVLGIGEVEIGEKFHCVLHPEERESAAILRPAVAGDAFMYMDFHEREEGRQAYPLPLVYFRLLQGREAEPVKRLNKPTFLVWALRLLRDAGIIKGVKIDAPRLPANVKASVRRVYEGFLDLLSLKFLVEEAPSPYTWTFASAWVGLSKHSVSSAWRWLIGAGYGRFVKYFEDGGGDKLMLFLPGTRSWIRRLSGRGMLARGGQTEVVAGLQQEAEAEARAVQAEEAAKAVLKICPKCGEVREWYTFGEVVVCATCYGFLDTS